jgi:hypothetical protein
MTKARDFSRAFFSVGQGRGGKTSPEGPGEPWRGIGGPRARLQPWPRPRVTDNGLAAGKEGAQTAASPIWPVLPAPAGRSRPARGDPSRGLSGVIAATTRLGRPRRMVTPARDPGMRFLDRGFVTLRLALAPAQWRRPARQRGSHPGGAGLTGRSKQNCAAWATDCPRGHALGGSGRTAPRRKSGLDPKLPPRPMC